LRPCMNPDIVPIRTRHDACCRCGTIIDAKESMGIISAMLRRDGQLLQERAAFCCDCLPRFAAIRLLVKQLGDLH